MIKWTVFITLSDLGNGVKNKCRIWPIYCVQAKILYHCHLMQDWAWSIPKCVPFLRPLLTMSFFLELDSLHDSMCHSRQAKNLPNIACLVRATLTMCATLKPGKKLPHSLCFTWKKHLPRHHNMCHIKLAKRLPQSICFYKIRKDPHSVTPQYMSYTSW